MIDSPTKTHKPLNPTSHQPLFDKLTDELLIQTLIHLPIKPLTICTSLSSRFHSLLSTPYFITSYITHSHPSFALYYQSKPSFHNLSHPSLMPINLTSLSPLFASPAFSLSFLSNPNQNSQQTIQFLASNNGLVLCCAALSRPVIYFVCNPLTKRFVALPPPPSNAKTGYIGFVCDPPQFNVVDTSFSTSFKVVRIEVVRCECPRLLSSTLKLEIFCSVSGKWTEEYFMSGSGLDQELFYAWNYKSPSAVVCNGLLHWDTLSSFGVFTYDPSNGECRTIEMPSEIRKPVWAFKHCLGEYSGRLRYVNFSWDDSTYRVWELKDGGGEWWLLHKVHLDEMKSTVESIKKECMGLVSIHPLNKDIIFFWCRSSCRIVEYDMRNKVLRLPRFIKDAEFVSNLRPVFFPFVLPSWPTAVPSIQQHEKN